MFFIFIVFFIFVSCSNNGEEPEEVFARVGNKTLTKKDLVEMKKVGLVSEGSVSNLVNNWVEKTLLYNEAVKSGLKKDTEIIRRRDRFYKDLLVSSFLEIQTKNKINITKKEVSNYYAKNKKSFTRPDDEIIIKHFVLPSNKESIKLKKLLKGGVGAEIEKYVTKHSPQTRLLYRHTAESSAVGFVFTGSVGDILGPKKNDEGFHLFEILKKYKKGSERGLELVYDEIYQRILKQKKESLVVLLLDSLYLSSDVFISPEIQ